MTKSGGEKRTVVPAFELEEARAESSALRRSVEIYRGLLDDGQRARAEELMLHRPDVLRHAPCGVVVGSVDGAIGELMNPAFAAMHGYSLQELVGLAVTDLFAPECRPDVADHLRLACEKGHHHWMARHARKDGSTFPVVAEASAVKGESGPVLYRFARVQDVTARTRTEQALWESERLHRAILQTAMDGFCMIAEDGRVLEVNEAFCRMSGYSEAELLAMRITDLEALETADETALHLEQIRMHGQARFESRHRRKDGSVFDLEVSAQHRPADGARFVAFLRDITDRKRAESELRILSRAMEQSPASILITDRAGNIEYVNPRFEQVTGYTRAESLGKNPRILKSGTNSPATYSALWAAISEGGEWRGELCNRRKNGDVFWEYAAISGLKDEDGRIGHYVAVKEEVTDRKRAEEALKESEFFFRESQRAAFIGSYKTDFTAGIWESSDVLDQIFGIDSDYHRTVEGWLDLVHVEDRVTMNRYLVEEVIAKRRPFEHEYRIVRKNDGETRWVHGRGAVAFDERGSVVSMIGTIQDVTERKVAEAERANLESQLQQAQKMEFVGRLAGGVAHDFNNMLGVILGHTELALEMTEPSQPIHDDLLEICKAASRSAELTRQLLAFARKQTIAPKVLDLNDAVAGMLTMLRRLLGENIQIKWLPGEGVWPIKMDPSQIDQVLANLCVNARDAIADVGNLTIETTNRTFDEEYCASHAGFLPGEYLRLAVSDDGCGMDKETLAHVFEPFFTTKGVGEGTGLGLATVYGIVRQNGGFLNAYSEPGSGSTFTIYLPRHVGGAESARPAHSPRTSLPGKETILLVEDEPGILKMTARILRRLGYTVLTASTPSEAIGLAERHAGGIHLLVTDIVMPEMNGGELARRVLMLCPHMKRLFMSGYTANVIAHHGALDAGVNFIQKPFSKEDLAAKVREVLDNEPAD